MANSNHDEVDRLSELPEQLLLQIISLLPTKFAVRTDVLARRYRRLWTASSSLELDRSDFPHGRLFNSVTSRYLRLRDPSSPLRSFCLKTQASNRPFSINLLSNWLNRAYSLGLRDLSLYIHSNTIESLFPLILSFESLHSLFLNAIDLNWSFRDYSVRHWSIRDYSVRPLVPATFPLTQLKYLHIKTKISDLQTFITQQRNLEYLCIEPLPSWDRILDLSSQSVKTLKLSSEIIDRDKICLSFPKLEFLDLSICLSVEFYVEMPVLRKALIETSLLLEESLPVLCGILKSITNVSELTLHIGAMISDDEFDLFHPLVEPGKDMLTFPNLRSFKLSMCFYENALQDLICLLHHSPVIDSLHLIHMEQPSDWASEVWHSKLPLNSEGNRKYAHFSTLQIGDKKSEVIKLLSHEMSSKRMKT